MVKGYKMLINDIFYSLQGEGNWGGMPNIFIRTTGCNLRCTYCDTIYAYDSGKEMSIEYILDKVSNFSCKYICITGGEPLIQKDIMNLIKALIKRKYNLCLETNGSLDIEGFANKKSLMISLDIKCPSSTMDGKNLFNNINFLRQKDQLKFIILDRNDYDYAKKIVEKYKPKCCIYFQPVWGTDPFNLADWIISDKLNVNLGLQLHKIIWGENRKN